MKDYHVDATQQLILGICTVQYRCLSNVTYCVSSTNLHSIYHQLLYFCSPESDELQCCLK